VGQVGKTGPYFQRPVRLDKDENPIGGSKRSVLSSRKKLLRGNVSKAEKKTGESDKHATYEAVGMTRKVADSKGYD